MDGLFGVTFIPGWNTTYAGQTTGPWKVCHTCGVRPAAVHDGLSNTMAVSEVCFINSQAEGRGTWAINMPGAGGFMAKTRPNAQRHQFDRRRLRRGADVRSDDSGQQSHALHAEPLERQHLGRCAEPASHRRERVMADGAVGFVSNSINIGVWQAMATIAGGEVETRPF